MFVPFNVPMNIGKKSLLWMYMAWTQFLIILKRKFTCQTYKAFYFSTPLWLLSALLSWAPSYVPFTVESCTFSHAPIFGACLKRRATRLGASSSVSSSAVSNRKKSPLQGSDDRGMVRRPELLPSPECCNKLFCDETGCFPVLRGRLCGV